MEEQEGLNNIEEGKDKLLSEDAFDDDFEIEEGRNLEDLPI